MSTYIRLSVIIISIITIICVIIVHINHIYHYGSTYSLRENINTKAWRVHMFPILSIRVFILLIFILNLIYTTMQSDHHIQFGENKNVTGINTTYSMFCNIHPRVLDHLPYGYIFLNTFSHSIPLKICL